MPLVAVHSLPADTVWGLWQITESVEELCACLPVGEVQTLVGKISHPQKLLESLSARVLLQELLGRQGIVFESLAKTPEKAPYLLNAPHCVSISHTAQYAVAISNPCLRVGIDIEQARPQLQRIGWRIFSPTELEFAQDVARLSLIWSAKETLYKLYAERQLDFAQDIHIAPFELENTGYFEGKLFPTKLHKKTFRIYYTHIDETHFCTWAVAS